jgi:predicted heme/steroid binding protein
MKLTTLIKNIIREEISDNAFSKSEVYLFKFLNQQKGKLRTKDEYIDVTKKLLKMLGLRNEDALYYYTLYTLNYREDGKYEETTKDQLKDFYDVKEKRTPNYKMSTFAKIRIPFEGSNVKGFWEKDPKGVKQFVITSYEWYPIYIFKNGVWYQVSNSYSPSTGTQMRQTRILGNQDLTPQMMNQLRNGVDIEEIKKKQREEFLKELNQKFASKNYSHLKLWILIDGQYKPMKVKFSINYFDEQDGKVLIDLDIHEIKTTNYVGGKIETWKPDELDEEKIRSIKGSLERGLSYRLPQEIRTTSEIEVIPNFKLE